MAGRFLLDKIGCSRGTQERCEIDANIEIGDFVFRFFIPVASCFVVLALELDEVGGWVEGLLPDHAIECVGIGGVIRESSAELAAAYVVGREGEFRWWSVDVGG